MSISKKLTIITPMGGRWHSINPYLTGIKSLDVDPSTINVVWLSNAQEVYVDLLKEKATELESVGFSVKVIHDQEMTLSDNVYNDSISRTDLFFQAIAALYNAAWQYTKTDDVLVVDDDVVLPSHTIKRLLKVLDGHSNTAVAGGAAFERHITNDNDQFPRILARNVEKDPHWIRDRDQGSTFPYPLTELWGVRKVDLLGFCCTLIRKSRLPENINLEKPFRIWSEKKGENYIQGADFTFCWDVNTGGKDLMCDFDVRPLHLDVQARAH